MKSNKLQQPANRPMAQAAGFHSKPGTPELVQKFAEQRGSVAVPDAWRGPMAGLVLEGFASAVRHRATSKLGNTTVEETLHRCWRQVEGEIDPAVAQMVEDSGVDLIINMTLLKTEAWANQAETVIADTADMPWVVEPTAIPSLSESAKARVLQRVKKQLFDPLQEMPDDLEAFVRQAKAVQLNEERESAKRAAKSMARLMHDQAQEGGMQEALRGVIRDFGVYPYAVLQGPVPTVGTRLKWQGDKLRAVEEVYYTWRRRSPFDFYWSSDSPDSQRGSRVFLKDQMTKAELLQAAQTRSYIPKAVLAAIEYFSGPDVSLNWMSQNPEKQNNIMWGRDETIDVITMYGKLSANELRPFGLQVHDGTFYEATVKVLGGFVIMVHVNKNPNPHSRPVFTAAMSNGSDRIPGKGLAQKLRDIERGYHSALQGLVRNNHYASGPIGEVDFSRIARWTDPADASKFDPYTIMPTDADNFGGGRPAHYFHTVPSIASQALNIMEYFERLADRHSQIPAGFHGEAVGSGVNRTFRGVTLLQGNALKGVQAALRSLGGGIITPTASHLNNLNLLYSRDQSVKGDSQAKVSDIGGLLAKEIKKQSTQETLMLVSQIAQGGNLPAGALEWATNEALEAVGADLERFMSVGGDAEIPAMPPGQAQLPADPAQEPAPPADSGQAGAV